MRRIDQNLGEKRVFLGSLNKKNNLRTTYERLNLEEKAFISSNNFNQRQLLSRQNKLRQLHGQSSRANLETRPKAKTHTSFPDLNGGNDSLIRSYANRLSLPYSRNGLRGPGEGRLGSLLGKEGSFKQAKFDNTNYKSISQSNASSDLLDEKRNEIKTPFKSTKVDSKSKQVQRSGTVHVGDIVAYSTSYGKRTKPQRRISSIDEVRDVKIARNEISEGTMISEDRNFALKKPTLWMNDLHSSESTELNESTSFLENQDMNSTKLVQPSDKSVHEPKDLSSNATSRQHSSGILSERTTLGESAAEEGDLIAASWLRDSRTAGTRIQADTNTYSDEPTSESQFMTSSLEHSQENDGADVPASSRKPSDPLISISLPQVEFTEDTTERTTSSVPALVSRSPSWTASKALPALGRIRRGSFCDVKTFKSGKVLDLLSSCEIPEVESKNGKQFLTVDNENLKYCRYLRSVTPEEASQGGDGETLEIPLKYRPSKNIIIGHTKINLTQ